MNRRRGIFHRRPATVPGLVLVLVLFVRASGADSAGGAEPTGSPDGVVLSWKETAAQIDGLFAAAWQRHGVVPAEPASDEEFIRRVYLDLAGRIPSVSEVRAFLASDDPDRRERVVATLLENPAWVRHMTIVWRNALIPQAVMQADLRPLVPGFEAWLWERLAAKTPYDRLVREILTTDVQAVSPFVVRDAVRPDAFFAAGRLKPENLAAATTRAFLGVRLDCAQCHDHPFDRWKQDQFWKLAAFYSELPASSPGAVSMQEAGGSPGTIRIPDTDQVVSAVFLTGEVPRDTRFLREQLADWITSPNNPWFARMAVNRLWAQFFGRGFVDPIDDFSDANPAVHPEVLDLLAEQFVAHDFDLTFVIRSITASQVYQRSGVQTHASQSDTSMFARAAVRGLTPEQFFDSLAEAVGFYQPYRQDNPFVIDMTSARGRFLELFRSDGESVLEHETTILQALAMMNGDFTGEATSLKDSRTLRAVTEFPLMSDSERLETLFLAALARRPSPSERDRFLRFLDTHPDGQAAALSDIFWVLLNSSEFLLNH